MEENQVVDFYLLIPFYNNLPGLRKSLESVHYATASYAILIVDDGSAQPLQYNDLIDVIPSSLQIKILYLSENKGITQALNTGLQWLGTGRSKFIARLDCGDICAPERFTQQVEFLNNHPDIDLVGSWCLFTNYSSGWSYQYITPTDHKNIVRGMHFRNIFIHPTVMWRASVAVNTATYPENFPHAEDYGFFYEIINKGQAAVIPQHLVTCEVNPKGISLFFRKEQLKSRIRVVRQYGKNKLLSLIGILKLRIMLLIPYRYVLAIKKRAYGI